MKQFLLSLLLLTAVSSLQATDMVVKITVGMSYQETTALLKKHGADDITPNLAIVGPNGEHPLTGIVWELRNYGTIIEINDKEGKVSGLIYNTAKDFEVSKEHRARMKQNVKSLTLDPKSRTISLEK